MNRVMHLYAPAGERFILVRPTEGGRQWLKDHDLPAFWSRTAQAFLLRPEHSADLLAMGRHEGWVIYEHNSRPKPRRTT
jgi:hypothetical protein